MFESVRDDLPLISTPWLYTPVPELDKQVLSWAEAYQGQLTKPPGSLGQLEQVAIRLAAMQGQLKPTLERVAISVFAADHGIVAAGVSAFPQTVTAEMVRNFSRGGAAISVLARRAQAHFEVVNLGTVTELEPLDGVLDARIAAGTANFLETEAMTGVQLEQALVAGAMAAERARDTGSQLFIGGEMGIGNTTSAAALAAVLLALPPEQVTGAGTGMDAAGVTHKCDVITAAICKHGDTLTDKPLAVLQCLGGFEIAALVGAYVRAAQLGVPVLVDGFISSVAALLAVRLNPSIADWLLFSHQSAEAGHGRVLEALAAEPLLSIGMRLGEASGAALVVPLLQSACALHAQMATFAEAEVTDG